MAHKGNNGESSGQSEMMYIAFAICIGLLCWIIWGFGRKYIVIPTFTISWIELRFIEFFTNLPPDAIKAKEYILRFMDGRNDAAKDISWSQFVAVKTIIGDRIRYLSATLIAIMIGIVIFKMKGNGYRRSFSLINSKGKTNLAKYQAEEWKVASISANFDYDHEDNDITQSMTPMEWCKEHNVEYENSKLDRDAAEEIFKNQLGNLWHGFDRASLPVKAILIACLLHAIEDKGSLLFRSSIAVAWTNRKTAEAKMKELLKPYENPTNDKNKKIIKKINKIAEKHAYEKTVVIRLLEMSRKETGVLAPQDFLWVKKVDRHLWYAINNVGRHRFHIEGAGPIAHFFAENVLDNKIIDPFVEKAVDGIEDYMEEQGIESVTEFFKQYNKKQFDLDDNE